MSQNEGTTAGVEINLAEIEAELAGMSEEQLAAELLKVRTRQKVQQKKMQGSPSHKQYQLKAQAKRKALIAKAKELGIYDKVNEQAETEAEAQIKAKAESTVTAEEVAAE